jgi:hypothetical protein
LYGSARNILGQTIDTCTRHEIGASSGKMSEEPTIDEIPEDANLPATKRDVAVVKKEIHDSVNELRTEMSEMRK